MRKISVGVMGVAGWSALMAGCAQQEGKILAHLPDPALHSMVAKPKTEPIVPQIIRPQTAQKPSVYSEPGWLPPGGLSNRWECIVVHHSDSVSGNAAGFDAWHRQRGWDELGYHFVIDNGAGGPDGRVEVGSRWPKQKHGAHCKVPGNYYNEHGVGICLVGNFEKGRPTAKQMESLRKLVTFLMVQGNIAPNHILGHCEANGNKTKCPGRYFAMDRFRADMGSQRSVAYKK